jgi:pantetheine-phosphate adenylyltransferase
MPTTAVFPGTFDPITLGHQDLLVRSARMFDRVVVAVAAGHHKKTMFTLDERVAMVRDATKRLRNVQVETFDGLMNEFVLGLAPKRDHKVVVRGVRGPTDFDYEVQLAGMNRERHAAIETVFLLPNVAFQFLSSSRVREISTLGGDVSRWVSPGVLARVQAKQREAAR